MEEKIVVKNFSVIDDIEIDVKKINILIGPQSTGKSLLAKLVYFFKTINFKMYDSIINQEGKRKLDNRLRSNFDRIFPDYILKEKPFAITYYYGENLIRFSNEEKKGYKSIKITYSDEVYKAFQKLKKDFSKKIKSEKAVDPDYLTQIKDSMSKELQRFFFEVDHSSSIFIPAGRSFFVIIEKTIFTLLERSVLLDDMLIRFGAFLQNIRILYQSIKSQKDFDKELYLMCKDVLGGEYAFNNELEWIKTKDQPWVSLRDSSSGQQEVAPLLVPLMVISNDSNWQYDIFIEEPETHLFPESQRKVVEIIAAIYNLFRRENGFFITTHSPYILTAFNNLIQAENARFEVEERFEKGEIEEDAKTKRLKELDKLVKPAKRVSFDDVAVYLIKDGTSKDIKNYENKLIDENDIDTVSDRTAAVFDRLLDISLGDE